MLGITLNFAPSADVAVDPSNPVIGTRAFGDDPQLVARHTAAFIAGHQAAGIHACVKHFPGHGDTAADTHVVGCRRRRRPGRPGSRCAAAVPGRHRRRASRA